MKRIVMMSWIVVGACFFSTPAFAENWLKLDETELVEVQLDLDSIRQEGPYKTYWFRQRSKLDGSYDPSYKRAVDCVNGKYSGSTLGGITAPGLQNTPIEEASWREVTSDYERAFMSAVCG